MVAVIQIKIVGEIVTTLFTNYTIFKNLSQKKRGHHETKDCSPESWFMRSNLFLALAVNIS